MKKRILSVITAIAIIASFAMTHAIPAANASSNHLRLVNAGVDITAGDDGITFAAVGGFFAGDILLIGAEITAGIGIESFDTEIILSEAQAKVTFVETTADNAVDVLLEFNQLIPAGAPLFRFDVDGQGIMSLREGFFTSSIGSISRVGTFSHTFTVGTPPVPDASFSGLNNNRVNVDVYVEDNIINFVAANDIPPLLLQIHFHITGGAGITAIAPSFPITPRVTGHVFGGGGIDIVKTIQFNSGANVLAGEVFYRLEITGFGNVTVAAVGAAQSATLEIKEPYIPVTTAPVITTEPPVVTTTPPPVITQPPAATAEPRVITITLQQFIQRLTKSAIDD
jgi:hypothetical protein